MLVWLHVMCGVDANVETDLSFLTNPVRSGLGLQVILRVPVGVKNDHCIRRGQVNAQTTCSRGQQEAEILQETTANLDFYSFFFFLIYKLSANYTLYLENIHNFQFVKRKPNLLF